MYNSLRSSDCFSLPQATFRDRGDPGSERLVSFFAGDMFCKDNCARKISGWAPETVHEVCEWMGIEAAQTVSPKVFDGRDTRVDPEQKDIPIKKHSRMWWCAFVESAR